MVTRVWKIIAIVFKENIHTCYCITDVSASNKKVVAG